MPSLFQKLVASKVATKLILILALLVGMFGVYKIPTTLFPDFEMPIVRVSIAWPGASASDVEEQIIKPLELALKPISQLDNMRSIAAPGVASVNLRYYPNQDLIRAENDVKQRIDAITTFPENHKTPSVKAVDFYDAVTSMLIYGQEDSFEIRAVADNLKDKWLDLGFAKVVNEGLPNEEINIELTIEQMLQNQLGVSALATGIESSNYYAPAGEVGDAYKPVVLRSKLLAETAWELQNLPIRLQNSKTVLLGDVATITRKPEKNAVFYEQNNKPVIESRLYRPKHGDTVVLARILNKWLANNPIPDGVRVEPFRQTWTFIYNRLQLLLNNAMSGLVLILLLLSVFIGWQMSFWVVAGIPIAILGAIFVLYMMGRSLNIMSGFAFILALGIIVDDAIVVAEETETQKSNGINPEKAAAKGASAMLSPVLASSMTTVAAMLPLFFVRGVWADFLLDIPLVIIAVILASLVECFCILPGHLARIKMSKPSATRKKLTALGKKITHNITTPCIGWALQNRAKVLGLASAGVVLTVGLLWTGHQSFIFYPKSDGEEIVVNVTFKPSTTISTKKAYMQALEASLWQAEEGFRKQGNALVKKVVIGYNTHKLRRPEDRMQAVYPERYASMFIELTDRDTRTLSNQKLITAWQQLQPKSYDVTTIDTISQGGGPPQEDISILLTGSSLEQIKQASMALQQKLKTYNGVYNIKDNLPYGKERIIYTIKPEVIKLGISKKDIARQLQAMLQGQSIGYFYKPGHAIELKVGLDTNTTDYLTNIPALAISDNAGNMLPLEALVNLHYEQGFDMIPHENGQAAVRITAVIDEENANMGQINQQLWNIDLPSLLAQYPVSYMPTADKLRQTQTLTDMLVGGMVGVVCIYLILVGMFGSYLWPLAVLSVVPMGLIGAIWGHYLLGLPLSLFSLFGFFTLSGIVINDAIILLVRYRELLGHYDYNEALMQACSQRVRAVVLTSITTIGGLVPILIDQSATAKYFHTTAATIIFGLLFSTALILILIPVVISLLDELKLGITKLYKRKKVHPHR